MSEQIVPSHSAAFDLETPPGSATAATAEEGGHFSKELDNLATVSLDTPTASQVPPDSAFAVQAAGGTGQLDSAASGTDVSSANASTGGSLLATVTDSSLPPSLSLSGFTEPQESVNPLLTAGLSGLLTAAPASSSSEAPPDLPKASPVKVWVKDPEKVSGKLLAGHISCVVRTECSSSSPLAAGAATSSAVPASSHSASDAVGSAAAEAGGDSPSKQARRQQEQQAGSEGVTAFEVKRRFDDFEVLARLLRGPQFKGYFIPRLPPSDWLSGGDNYLRTRKVDLQDYLSQVVNHPVLQGSEELRLFLTQPGELAACDRWQRMVQRPAPMDTLLGIRKADSPSRNSAAAGGSGGTSGGTAGAGVAGWGGMMRSVRHSIMSVVQPKAQPELPADEQQLRQAKEWFKELQQHLSVCCSVVRSLMAHMEAQCEDYGELGRALSHFARFEEAMAQRQGQYTTAGSTAVQRGADLQKLGYGALRQHSLSKQFVVNAGASLVFLPDWHALIPECVATLQEREDALASVQLLSDQLHEKQDTAARLAAGLGPAADADKRMVALAASVHALQDKLLAAEQQYKLLKERNQAELTRLNLQRADDFRRALARFAVLQAQAAAAAADVWSGVADQLTQ